MAQSRWREGSGDTQEEGENHGAEGGVDVGGG